ncbi:hypothetical protein HYPSUDRAFT_72147 [Hypholoma sublateritium FD-334 SS-4]|uniref:DUF6533 domain-containing protein n=1 Tax=Hypholoma sublateritium (strain FD-334 SS-4) TaxID=945553 RepID=A0A0D2KL07_HYPSF|nr:hypothetical protein HYPSUDRAFT_72147 [Hypholoma sublateritium FD-334 SS-4]
MSNVAYDSLSSVREIRLHDYLHIFAISFLFYDHAITIGEEIEYLWKRPKNRSTYWLFVNRYLAFFGNIAVVVLGFTTLSTSSCQHFNVFRQILLISNQVVVSILLTLRIYALYGCSMRILAYMVGTGLILAAISLWTLFGQKSAPSERASGCHVGFARKSYVLRQATAWEALFIYDLLIFSLTIIKTWKARRDHAITGISIPLISLILRDGIMSVTMMSRLSLNLYRTADHSFISTTQGHGDEAYIPYSLTGSIDIVNPESMAFDLDNYPKTQSLRRYDKPPPRQ